MPQDPNLTEAIRRAAVQQAMQQKAVEADVSIARAIGIKNAGNLMECPICGQRKWKTVLRGSAYGCRTCGYVRTTEDPESADLPD